MSWIWQALMWILDSANWSGPGGIAERLLEHLGYTLAALALASLIALPVGWLVGHWGRGKAAAIWITSALRSIPTLGLVTLAGLMFGIGWKAPIIALVILALPTLLAGAYAGVESTDPRIVEAARAQGFTQVQILFQVEIPLGATILWGAMRSATLQIVSTATLAAYVGAGGLGGYMFLGLSTQDYPLMLASSFLVIALAFVFELLFLFGARFFLAAHLNRNYLSENLSPAT
ncbi:MAG: ABC transporter permease [Actinomycetaceae bacterium]|nr:ABC transporter permease [Actinomycetaceae bacterium]